MLSDFEFPICCLIVCHHPRPPISSNSNLLICLFSYASLDFVPLSCVLALRLYIPWSERLCLVCWLSDYAYLSKSAFVLCVGSQTMHT